ncbi:MAG: zf-HC2 domain-containing protein [Acidimicrobiales bacterium]
MNTDEVSGRDPCEDTEASLAELALGILPGDERARMLAHLEGCERCQVEAERLTATADTLLHLAPEIEPPLGLEVRLFERLDVSVPTSESKVARKRIGGSLVRLSHRGRVLVAAAATAAAIALGFGGGWLANTGAPVATNSYPRYVTSATATLTSDTRDIGSVVTVGGSPGWMLMTVQDGSVNGTVTCEVTSAYGKYMTVGSFRLHDGSGSWAARLPSSVESVRSARIVAPGGAVVGSATFT